MELSSCTGATAERKVELSSSGIGAVAEREEDVVFVVGDGVKVCTDGVYRVFAQKWSTMSQYGWLGARFKNLEVGTTVGANKGTCSCTSAVAEREDVVFVIGGVTVCTDGVFV